jgi:hypothetical protein
MPLAPAKAARTPGRCRPSRAAGCGLHLLVALLTLGLGYPARGEDPPATTPAPTTAPPKKAATTSTKKSKAKTPAPAAAATAPCVPDCREGFVCKDGTCLSLCNPVCPAGQRCTAESQCVAEAPPPVAAPPVAVAPPPAAAPAQQSQAGQFSFGVQIGMLFPGEVTFWRWGTANTEIGWMSQIYVDYRIVPWLSLGALFVGAFPGGGQDTNFVLGLGLQPKGHIPVAPWLELRPGLAVTFQYSQWGRASDVTGLGLAGFLESAIVLSPSTSIPIQVGVLSQPLGGASGVDDVTFLIFYLTAGFEY